MKAGTGTDATARSTGMDEPMADMAADPFAELVERFCAGQSALRARLARTGDAVDMAPSGCSGVAV